MKKKLTFLALTAGLTLLSSVSAYAGDWKQDAKGWWWQEDNGSYPVSTWKTINGKSYYFDSTGYMLANTTTPDGYQVGADGAWIENTNTNQFKIKDTVKHCLDAASLEGVLNGLTNVSTEVNGWNSTGDIIRISADGLPTSVEWENGNISIWTRDMTEIFDGITKDYYTVSEYESMLRSIRATNIKSTSEKITGSIAGIDIDEYYVNTSFELGNYTGYTTTYPKNNNIHLTHDTQVGFKKK